jgi:hypothetical protein
MDFGSGKVDEVFEGLICIICMVTLKNLVSFFSQWIFLTFIYYLKAGSPRILEICGQLIGQNLSILDKIPCDQFQQKTNNVCVLDGFPHSDLLSSSTTLQNHMFICDKGNPSLLGHQCSLV